MGLRLSLAAKNVILAGDPQRPRVLCWESSEVRVSWASITIWGHSAFSSTAPILRLCHQSYYTSGLSEEFLLPSCLQEGNCAWNWIQTDTLDATGPYSFLCWTSMSLSLPHHFHFSHKLLSMLCPLLVVLPLPPSPHLCFNPTGFSSVHSSSASCSSLCKACLLPVSVSLPTQVSPLLFSLLRISAWPSPS